MIVIVLDESYRDEYAHLLEEDSRIRWADPGTERQVSPQHWAQTVCLKCMYVCMYERFPIDLYLDNLISICVVLY